MYTSSEGEGERLRGTERERVQTGRRAERSGHRRGARRVLEALERDEGGGDRADGEHDRAGVERGCYANVEGFEHARQELGRDDVAEA